MFTRFLLVREILTISDLKRHAVCLGTLLLTTIIGSIVYRRWKERSTQQV